MKHYFFTICLTLSAISCFTQQEGLIKYKETIKLDIKIEMPEGIDISGMLPESTTSYTELYFNKQYSLYQDTKNSESSDQEISNDDGSVQIIIQEDSQEKKLFTDFNAMSSVFQTGFMGKSFLIEDKVETYKWKMTGEKIKYLGYECHKAELIIKAESSDEDDKHVVAWFAPAIKSKAGPSYYNQLPGAILMLSENEDQREIMATEINLEIDPVTYLQIPTKGKKVSDSEFQNIVKAKEKEMKEMYGERSIFINH